MTQRIFALLVLMAAAGCAPDTPEARLESAGEKLESTEETLDGIERRIDEQEQVLADLESRKRQLKRRVMTLEERVAARATDVALFRAVQSALLEEEQLEEAAISVDAEDGVVTLSGIVSLSDEERTATEIAAAVPGVESVESRIVVEPEANSSD